MMLQCPYSLLRSSRYCGHFDSVLWVTIIPRFHCTTIYEKDVGVKISADMKVSEQCSIAASKGNQILGLIGRNVTYKVKALIVALYKAIIRPHLEYCIQTWRPHRYKDKDTLE